MFIFEHNYIHAKYVWIHEGFPLQCRRQHAIEAFYEQVPYSEPKRVALIGGGCSVATESIAETSHHFNLMQVQ